MSREGGMAMGKDDRLLVHDGEQWQRVTEHFIFILQAVTKDALDKFMGSCDD